MMRFRLFAAFAILGGCVDPLEPRDRPPSNVSLQPACAAARGTRHTSLKPGSHRFRRTGNPHWVMQTLRVESGTLTIEAGATVCFTPAAELEIADSARVEVYGTQSAPVLLTAMDPAQPWGGIRHGGINGPTGAHLTLVNARLEHATEGVAVLSFIVDSTVIRQIQGRAIRGDIYYMEHFLNVRGNGRITNSRVDTACAACGDGAAIETGAYTLVIEQTAIRGSGGHGVRVHGGSLSLYDVLIEGSAQTGLVMRSVNLYRAPFPIAPVFATPPVSVRITAGRSYPAELPAALANQLMPDAAADARVLGNANDALLLWGGIDGEAVIRGRLPWLLTGVSGHDIKGHLRLEAGAVLRMMGTPTLNVSVGGRITANGSPDRPVTLSGLFLGLSGEPSAPSRVTHARLENVRLLASDAHGVIVEDVVGTSSRLIIGAPGSQVRRARFDGSFASGGTQLVDSATVVVHAPGVLVSDVVVRRAARHGFLIAGTNAHLSGCEASGNGDAGVRVTNANGVRIVACNFFDNAGPGVLNTAADTVDARDNWWGSPAGPAEPAGDGVSGLVSYLPYLASPAAAAGAMAPISAHRATDSIPAIRLRTLERRPPL